MDTRESFGDGKSYIILKGWNTKQLDTYCRMTFYSYEVDIYFVKMCK